MKNAIKTISPTDLDITIQGLVRTIFLLKATDGSEAQVKEVRKILQEILLYLPEKIVPYYLTDMRTTYYQCIKYTSNVTYYSHGAVSIYSYPFSLLMDPWQPVTKAEEYRKLNELAAAQHDYLITGTVSPILLEYRKKEYSKYLRDPHHLFIKWQIAKYLDQKFTLPRSFPKNIREYYDNLKKTLRTATKESVVQIESPQQYNDTIINILSLNFRYNSADPESHTMSAEIPYATHLKQITEEFVFGHNDLIPMLRYTDFFRLSSELYKYSTLTSLPGNESYTAISRCNEIDRFLQLMDVVKDIAGQNQEISQFLEDINIL